MHFYFYMCRIAQYVTIYCNMLQCCATKNNAGIAGFFRADDAVPHDLSGGEAGRARGEFTGIVYEVPTNGNTHTIGIILLCAVVEDYPGVG